MKGFMIGDARAVTAGREGGRVSAVQRAILRRRAWAAEFPGIDHELAERIYRKGYVAGYVAGHQAKRKDRT